MPLRRPIITNATIHLKIKCVPKKRKANNQEIIALFSPLYVVVPFPEGMWIISKSEVVPDTLLHNKSIKQIYNYEANFSVHFEIAMKIEVCPSKIFFPLRWIILSYFDYHHKWQRFETLKYCLSLQQLKGTTKVISQSNMQGEKITDKSIFKGTGSVIYIKCKNGWLFTLTRPNILLKHFICIYTHSKHFHNHHHVWLGFQFISFF